jgi:hypothetical protein
MEGNVADAAATDDDKSCETDSLLLQPQKCILYQPLMMMLNMGLWWNDD